MIDNDFEESPDYELYMLNKTMADNTANGAVDYYANRPVIHNPIRQWDSGVWYDEDPNELAKSLVLPVTQPLTAEFNYKQHIVDKTQTTRNTLMFGSLETSTERIQLWGFLTWIEFQDHLADHQPLAKNTLENLHANASEMYHSVGQAKFTFWLAKNYRAQTRPGYWAIVVEEPHQRTVIHSVNGQLHFNSSLGLGVKNLVKISQARENG